ncbi:MAG: hypothetical protein ACI9W2_002241 [Gammaproteobacteria bacterium]|jgi:hypothetical protein
MTEASDTLPDDVDALKSLVVELQSKVGHQSQFIDQLLEQIKLGRHQRFGASSERFSLRQLQLLFNEAEAAAASDEASRTMTTRQTRPPMTAFALHRISEQKADVGPYRRNSHALR